MNAPIISVEHLSKCYKIGRQATKGDGLRHVLERAVRAPFGWLRPEARTRRAKTEEFWAIKDLSMEIKPGEMVGIIGRNGAGKSTLLKLLSRITEPTTGRIQLRGRVSSLLEVGTGFHPELTGRENIFLNGAILGMSRLEIKRKFDEIVAFAEISKFLDTPVKRYSSGMYVRLAFAVAAHLEPEILIVDEVLAVGDAEFQKKCLGKMEDVSTRQGRTVIIVSHQLPVIQNLCKRCVLMDEGKILYDGETAKTLEQYASHALGLAAVRLAERIDREGKGDGVVTDVRFLDVSGRPVREVFSGQDVVIRVRFRVRAGMTLNHSRISVTVVKNSATMMTLSTDLVDKQPLRLSGVGEVDFLVPDWPFSGGTYHISTYLASDGTITQDWVNDAAVIEVVDGDFYGTGKLYHPGWRGAVVLVHHSWEMRSLGPDMGYGQTVSPALEF